MSESIEPIRNRLSWLSFAALLTATFTFVGVNQPQGKNTTEESAASATNSDYPMPSGLISFEQGTWEDPYKQLHHAKEAIDKESASNTARKELHEKGLTPSELDQKTLQSILIDKLKDKSKKKDDLNSSQTENARLPKMLVVFSLVPGGESEVEARLRIRHSFEISMASRSFRPLLPNRVSFIRFPDLETHFTQTESVKYETEFPVKLYESDDDSATPGFILNVWVNEDLLGEKPWHFLNSIAGFIDSKELRANSQLAVVGPTTSDILEKLNPHCSPNSNGNYFLESPKEKPILHLLDWAHPIELITYQCTVPLGTLWPEEKNSLSSLEENLIVRVPIKNDEATMNELAGELKTRLYGNCFGKPTILLFVEQDKQFGRSLGTLLKRQLDDFHVITIGYLSGISTQNENGTRNPDSTGNRVTDYFQRTLKRDTESWHYLDANNYKPAAIGILGGSWEDKIELIREVRKRFPQPLCFTNDFDARYADARNIPITRNLLIQSHQDPKPRGSHSAANLEHTDDKFDVFFRDEYQAALFHGMRELLDRVYPENAMASSAPPLPPPTRIFEIGRDAAVVIPRVTEPSVWYYLFSFGCAVTLAIAYLFPLATLPSVREARILSKLRLPATLRTSFEVVWKNLPTGEAYSLPLLVFILCMLPFQPEMEGNRFLSLLSGVNVTPSIFCLSIAIPLLFRRAAKANTQNGIGREKRVNTVLSVFEECRSLVGLPPFATGPATSQPAVLRGHYFCFACIFVVLALGIRFWVTRDDPWLVQIGVLAAVSCIIYTNPTSRRAVELALAITVSLGFYRVAVSDFAIVPSRDPWIRLIGNSVFAIPYWWLLVSLIKLILYLNALREVFRVATKDVWEIRDQRTPVTDVIARKYDDLIDQAGNASAIVLRDLGIVIFIGAFVCLARLPVFDAWGISSATWLTIFIPMALPFAMAVFVRRGAWKFRDTLLRYLTRGTIVELNQSPDNDDEKVLHGAHKDVVNACIDSIKSYDRGTFCPIDRDPLISAGISLVIAFFSGPNNEIAKQIVSLFIV